MKVFHSNLEQEYHPRHSFFCGRFTPYPDISSRTRSNLEAMGHHPEFELHTPPPIGASDLETVHNADYLETLALGGCLLRFFAGLGVTDGGSGNSSQQAAS